MKSIVSFTATTHFPETSSSVRCVHSGKMAVEALEVHEDPLVSLSQFLKKGGRCSRLMA